MFSQLAQFTDVALLLLRLMVGLVFITSGWNHLKDPEARSEDIGMSKGFTIFLGAAEVAGSFGVIFGVLTQLAATGLILLMLGAIQKKIFVWRTGFWGESGTNGWSYDTMLVVMSLVIVTTGDGNFSVMKCAATLQLSKKSSRIHDHVGDVTATLFMHEQGRSCDTSFLTRLEGACVQKKMILLAG